MRASEKARILQENQILRKERDTLHKNYVNARQDTARELLNILLEEPYSAYIDCEIVYEIAKDIYGLKVINGRVSCGNYK